MLKQTFLAVFIAGVVLLLGGRTMCAAPVVLPPPTPKQVLAVLQRCGIPAESAVLTHAEWLGTPPVRPRYQCYYHVKYKDAEWSVILDGEKQTLIGVWRGGAVFVPGNKPTPIRCAADAVRLGEEWLRRFGMDPAKSFLYGAYRPSYGGRWEVKRFAQLAPGILVRVAIDIELDAATGGLIDFDADSEIDLPSPLPKPHITAEKAIAIAQAEIAAHPSEHFEIPTDTHLLDCNQFLTWNTQPDGKRGVQGYWRVRLYGRAKEISRLPPQYLKLKPPLIRLVLLETSVNADDGSIRGYQATYQNEIYTNGRQYRW